MNLDRIMRGVGANAYITVMTIILQIVTMPVLVAYWGLAGYGIWLIYSAIPAYLVLSNLGIAVVAGNRMAAELGADKSVDAKVIFSTAWASIAVLAVLLACAGAAALIFMPTGILPVGEITTDSDARWILGGLMTVTALFLLMDVLLAGYRATGMYATGTIIMGTTYALERVAILVVVLNGQGLVEAAWAMASMRAGALLFMLAHYRRAKPELQPEFKQFDTGVLRSIMPQSMGMMLLPAGFALNLQGPILLLGLVAGPAVVGAFGAMRTFTRFAVQIMNAVSTAVLPEFAMVAEAEERGGRNELFGLNLLTTLVLAAGAFAGLALLGPTIFVLWIGQEPPAPWVPLLLILSAGSILCGVWMMIANMLIAANRQLSYTPAFVIVSALLIGVAWLAGWGAEGLAWALLMSEAVMLAVVLFATRHLDIDGYGPSITAAISRLRR